MNHRSPGFVARDDLEQLMASTQARGPAHRWLRRARVRAKKSQTEAGPQVEDWVKLSEMLLGPAPAVCGPRGLNPSLRSISHVSVLETHLMHVGSAKSHEMFPTRRLTRRARAQGLDFVPKHRSSGKGSAESQAEG